MDNYQIFISYRRDGGEMLGQLLHDRLTQKGYTVFFDVESLRSGDFNNALYHVMENCTDVIVVLPPNALDRCKDENDWVRKEISFCISKKKNIIPIMMRNFVFPKDLPDDIAEIERYNGISANEIASFPWVIESLTTKFLHSNPQNSEAKSKKPGKASKILNFLRLFVCYSILAFPFLAQWFKWDLSPLPDTVEKYVTMYANYDLKIIVLIFALFFIFYMFSLRNNFEFIKNKNETNNIHEDLFNCSPDKFITALLSMESMAAIVKNNEEASDIPDTYAKYVCFKGMEIGSYDGSMLDYLYVDFPELPHPENISILYLDENTGKQRAILFLSKQGYVFSDEKDDILHFIKNDIHIRLAYTESGLHMLGMEISRSAEITRIREKTIKAWEESFVREAKLGFKKASTVVKKLFKRIEESFLKLSPKTQTIIVVGIFVLGVALIILLNCLFKDAEKVSTLSEMTEKATEYISQNS